MAAAEFAAVRVGDSTEALHGGLTGAASTAPACFKERRHTPIRADAVDGGRRGVDRPGVRQLVAVMLAVGRGTGADVEGGEAVAGVCRAASV